MYSFNVSMWVFQCLPPPLRGAALLPSLLDAATATLQRDGSALGPYAYRLLREARYTGQRMVIEAALNELLPDAAGGITVETLEPNEQVYIYSALEAETAPSVYLAIEAQPAHVVYYMIEGLASAHFDVRVPLAGGYAQTLIQTYINRLRQAGKTYKITYY
jgi:hypothetical protein